MSGSCSIRPGIRSACAATTAEPSRPRWRLSRPVDSPLRDGIASCEGSHHPGAPSVARTPRTGWRGTPSSPSTPEAAGGAGRRCRIPGCPPAGPAPPGRQGAGPGLGPRRPAGTARHRMDRADPAIPRVAGRDRRSRDRTPRQSRARGGGGPRADGGTRPAPPGSRALRGFPVPPPPHPRTGSSRRRPPRPRRPGGCRLPTGSAPRPPRVPAPAAGRSVPT